MQYRLATIPTFDRETLAEGEKPARDNDGSLIIMWGGPDDDDCRRALIVPRVARVKRAEAYIADDPEQLALALRVVAFLNAG